MSFVKSAAIALIALSYLNSAQASVIFGYNADQPSTAPPFTANTYDARFDRFSTNFPSEAPVGTTNSSFVLAGRDLSGVGWLTGDPVRRVTMISPKHFLTAAHITGVYTPGTSVSFLTTGNTVVTATIASASRVPSISGSLNPDTDILLGTLTTSVSSVNYYPIATGSHAMFTGRQGYLYDQEHRVGLNRIDGFTVANEGSVATTNVVGYGDDATGPGGNNPGELFFTVGDSGSPTFVITDNNILALIGSHYFIDTSGTPDFSFDSFLPDYINQMNAMLIPDSLNVHVTPVPEPCSLALMGLTAGSLLVRRIRRARA